MPDPDYFESSLTAQQIENVLTGVRSVTGLVKRNGESSYSQAIPGTDFAPPIIFVNDDPTSSTVGKLGQLLFNTSTKAVFVCTFAYESGGLYSWQTILSPSEDEDEGEGGIYVVEYGVTPHEDILEAISNGKLPVIFKEDENHRKYCLIYSNTHGGRSNFYAKMQSNNIKLASVYTSSNGDEWDFSTTAQGVLNCTTFGTTFQEVDDAINSGLIAFLHVSESGSSYLFRNYYCDHRDISGRYVFYPLDPTNQTRYRLSPTSGWSSYTGATIPTPLAFSTWDNYLDIKTEVIDHNRMVYIRERMGGDTIPSYENIYQYNRMLNDGTLEFVMFTDEGIKYIRKSSSDPTSYTSGTLFS